MLKMHEMTRAILVWRTHRAGVPLLKSTVPLEIIF